jgi:hypothetical protein
MTTFFENNQWKVTDYGMEGAGEYSWYHFNAERLVEDQNNDNRGRYYDWPLHMAEKTWIDIEAFISAFEEALKIHKARLPQPVDPTILRASLDLARKIARGP